MRALPVILVAVLGTCLGLDDTWLVCTVPQWEGYQFTIGAIYQNGNPVVVENFVKLAYDLNNTKLAAFTSGTSGGVPFKINYIYDYVKRVLYTINGETCTKTPLTGPFQKQCTPDGAVMVWVKTWLGEPGQNTSIWIYEFKGKQDAIDYHMSFTMWSVVPVYETLVGEINGDPFYQNSNFVNITTGIKDPSIFIPPATCNHVTLELNATTAPRFGILTR